MKPRLGARVSVEFVGTAFLVAAVVGSGIMAERLCGGNTGLALLANTIATAAALVALILTFGPISGAQFNPVVTLADAMAGGLPWAETSPYIAAQLTGGMLRHAACQRDVRFASRLNFSSLARRPASAPQ